MLIIKILIVATLMLLAFQDFKDRSVYAALFPALIILFFLMRLIQLERVTDILLQSTLVAGFLALQLVILALYFSLRSRRWTWVIGELLGWGDVCLLIAFCFYFSLLNFIAFYLVSTLLTVLVWMIIKDVFKPATQHIPLAGLQALFFLGVFFSNCVWPMYSVQDDFWILQLIR